jgi:hypothetical protein
VKQYRAGVFQHGLSRNAEIAKLEKLYITPSRPVKSAVPRQRAAKRHLSFGDLLKQCQ